MNEIIYLNGRLLPLQEARISVLDYGFLFGYGLFETMRAYNGMIFRLDRHLKRLTDSAELLNIPVDTSTLRNAVIMTLRANEFQNARVRLMVSIGEGSLVPDLHSCREPTVFVGAARYLPLKLETYERGYRIRVASRPRCRCSLLPRLKTANYLENLLSRQEALANDADDALILDESSRILETCFSNIFLVAHNILKTPRLEDGLLPGITREVVLELADQLGIEVQETDIYLAELFAADEIFLTNSILEIMPVTAVNGKMIAAGTPGTITGNLMEAYHNLVIQETRS
jgi:branched-chain amino acid aminotransferase